MLLQRAIANAKNARRLLARGDQDSLRYAALETRMAIEELFYALIPYYKEELPQDLLRRWQPRHIIDALLACNPMVEQYHQIVMRSKDNGKVIFAGHQTPATRELLKRYYQKLGSYLHASVDGKTRDETRMRQFLESALTRIDEHCRQTTVIHNGGLYFQHSCVCGRMIKRNFFAVGFRPVVQCPDEKCSAIYDVKIIKGGSLWRLRHIEFKCSKCRVKTPVGTHVIEVGRSFQCIGCGVIYDVTYRPVATARSGISEPHARAVVGEMWNVEIDGAARFP